MQYVRALRERLSHHAHYIGKGRLLRLGAASILVWSLLLPALNWLSDYKLYGISASAEGVLGEANPNLSAKFSFDAANDQWQFNKNGVGLQANMIAEQQGGTADDVANALRQLHVQVGGGGAQDTSLYSVNLPSKADKGITYYDNNTNLSFTMVPQFHLRDGKKQQGRIVYPFADGAQLIYTAKTNGLKEDIVLNHRIANALRFSYALELPKELAAHVDSDGSVGIYSADPALYGNVTASTMDDQAKLQSARQTATKDHLLFAIPPPVIKDANHTMVPAYYTMDGTELTVTANDLGDLRYPLSIDPSVVITSSSDFTNGNNESMISYSTAGQLSRAGQTGGSLSSWTNGATGLPDAILFNDTVAYNGYAYTLGGAISGSANAAVDYAPINTNGTIGTWVPTTSLPVGLVAHRAIAYNGFLYVIGGANGSSVVNTVYYAPINGTGTVGSWSTTSSLNTARDSFAAAVYKGYIYVAGGIVSGTFGEDTGDYTDSVEYAQIKSDGTLGSWTATTSLLSAAGCNSGEIYNGYFYNFDSSDCNGQDGSVAPIKSDGTLGSWTAISTVGCDSCATAVVNGYAYIIGGYTESAGGVSYAPIYANGKTGAWLSTTSTGWSGSAQPTSFTYGNYVYATGNGTTNVRYAQIDPAGVATAYTTSGNTFTTTRRGAVSVVYGGYLYVMGGDNGGTPVNTVYKAAINGDGTIGGFSSTTAFTTVRTYFAAVAYNGNMYVIGGCSSAYSSCTTATNNVATIYRSAINDDGTLGSWNNTNMTALASGRYGLAAAVYNGRLYVMGGLNGSTFQNTIQYNSINANGALPGAWTTSTKTLPNSEAYMAATIYGGNLLVAGGCTAGALTCTTALNTVQYAALDTSGDLSANLVATNTFTNARGMLGMTTVNGYLYIAGGLSNGTAYADTQYAQINTDGTLGSWAASGNASLATARYGIGMVSAGGRLYVTGGYNGTTYYNNVQIARVNNGGGGGFDSWSAGSTSASDERSQHATLIYNGYLYAIGGVSLSTLSGLNSLEYAPITDSGDTGSWTIDSHTLPLDGGSSRGMFGAVAYKGYMYIVGGWDGASSNNFLQTVYYAPIGASGALTANWASAGSNITNGGYGVSVVAYNGYLYVLGGFDGATEYNTVQYAQITSNGSLGGWSSTSSFTGKESDGAALAYNGYMYIAGGSSATDYNTVQYAPIGSGGTLGTWKSTTSFNGGRGDFNFIAYNGYMYIGQGVTGDGSIQYTDLQSAPINSNGTVGAWKTNTPGGTAAPSGDRTSASQIQYHGRLYAVGGSDASSLPIPGAVYASLSTIPNVAQYSTLINLGTDTGAVNLYYTGTFSPDSSVQYATAASGAVFSSLQSGVNGTGTPPIGTCSAGTLRYVWVLAVLDDTNQATFGGGSSPSMFTDITVGYSTSGRATPQQRLHGGKYFSGGTLQPLDTCGSGA